jgi:hypothetical protein
LLFISEMQHFHFQLEFSISVVLCISGKIQYFDFQLKFFGFFAWTMIQRTVLPLCIFFRFYSTIILVRMIKILGFLSCSYHINKYLLKTLNIKDFVSVIHFTIIFIRMKKTEDFVGEMDITWMQYSEKET